MQEIPNEVTINGKVFRIMLDTETIDKAVGNIAERINQDYAGKSPVFIITMKGAIFFAVDLLKKITLDCQVESIRAKSYGAGMVSGGNVLISQMTGSIEGKDVIILEDIVDTGLTAMQLIRELSRYKPNSVRIATFLMKPEMMKSEVNIDYVGIEIPSDFVVGYGLDYAEYGRNYPAVYSLAE